MKHTLFSVTALTAFVAAPSIASAQDAGWYIRGNMGYGAFADTDLTGDMPGDVEAEGNAAGSVGVGYALGNNWRVELDGNQMWNDMGAIAQVDASFASLRTTGLMLNAIYDFEDFGRWEPYVGAGLGYVKGKLSAESHDFANGLTAIDSPVCGDICRVEDDAASLGWNILAGLGYNINENLVWDTKYTYTDIGEMDFDGIRQTVGSVALSSISVAAEDLASHTLMTGFRYKFGAKAAPVAAPAPAPAPVANYRCWDASMVVNAASCPAEPAPEPTVTCWDGSMAMSSASCPAEPLPQPTVTCWNGSMAYDQASCPVQTVEQRLCGQEYVSQIVYFEFNKPQSAETQSQMQNILNISDVCQVGSVSLVGHTDTVGSAAYNLNLSRKRAKLVKKELVNLGVPADLVSTDGRGETDLFVPTADNVKEQLNRRVEVGIRLNSVAPSN